MNPVAQSQDGRIVPKVRLSFPFACAAFISGLIAPDVLHHRPTWQLITTLAAAIAIATGWYFLRRNSVQNGEWRSRIALISSIITTGLIAVLALELAPSFHFQFAHRDILMYARRCAYWTALIAGLAFGSSFLGLGRPRMAFAIGSALLLIVQLSLGGSIY